MSQLSASKMALVKKYLMIPFFLIEGGRIKNLPHFLFLLLLFTCELHGKKFVENLHSRSENWNEWNELVDFSTKYRSNQGHSGDDMSTDTSPWIPVNEAGIEKYSHSGSIFCHNWMLSWNDEEWVDRCGGEGGEVPWACCMVDSGSGFICEQCKPTNQTILGVHHGDIRSLPPHYHHHQYTTHILSFLFGGKISFWVGFFLYVFSRFCYFTSSNWDRLPSTQQLICYLRTLVEP